MIEKIEDLRIGEIVKYNGYYCRITRINGLRFDLIGLFRKHWYVGNAGFYERTGVYSSPNNVRMSKISFVDKIIIFFKSIKLI